MHARELEHALEQLLDAALSSRRTAEAPAHALAKLPHARQKFALHWTGVIAKSNSEMAYQFVTHAPRALELLDEDGARMWALRAMDVYDKQGLYPGSAALAEVEQYAREQLQNECAVTLSDARAPLERFLRALSGRALKVEVGARACTDTETIYLPERIARFDSREQNYLLYKAGAVHLWAQSRFGTFRRAHPHAPHLGEEIARIDASGDALQLFALLETIRLNACIERELPGLSREMRILDTPPPAHREWRARMQTLQHAGAGVTETLAATAALYPLRAHRPGAPPYQGEFDFDAARIAIERRLAGEKVQLQHQLEEMLGAQHARQKLDAEFTLDTETDGGEIELRIDGEPLQPAPDVAATLSSLLQDLDEVPQEWLQPAGDGAYDRRENAHAESAVETGGAFYYDEWDCHRNSYRKKWCALRETPADAVHDDFTAGVMKKYAHLAAEIRRRFEALRDANKILKAQPDGDDIDFDALVTAHADARAGAEMRQRLFTRVNKVERDLAVMFMVDASGSTKGWINEAERESLVLLCDALEILGDRYAIYAFSGMTRTRCEIYRIKTFAQPYDDETRARISGLRARDYTRMGAAIRHLNQLFAGVDARTKVLLTLSDGKPDDYDGYRGGYGIEDTRRALLEARHAGIRPFCITIDERAAEYLPRMYGRAGYAVIDHVQKLPLKIADIYRRLTT